jgi:DUF4097 and DUF4098 domain-containing protein YvlB
MRLIHLGAAALAISTVFAQMQDNREKHMTCENRGWNGDQAHHCDIREQTLPGPGHVTVDGGVNGGATVKGWLRNDVLVRAKVETWADDDAQASAIAGQIHVDTSGGQIRASGPDMPRHAGWSVSYEIFVPQTTDVNIKTHNGGVSISDVRGRIQFDAMNGGVHLKRIAGEVNGSTVNGGINVELAGSSFDGNQFEARTTNGGVTISMPENYSAHIRTETVNGSVRTDFPVTVQGEVKRNLDFNVGSGGPLIHVTTTNGGVRIKRS